MNQPPPLGNTLAALLQALARAADRGDVMVALRRALITAAPLVDWMMISEESTEEERVSSPGFTMLEMDQVADYEAGFEAGKLPESYNASEFDHHVVFPVWDGHTVVALVSAPRSDITPDLNNTVWSLIQVAAGTLRSMDLHERLITSEHHASVGRLAAGIAHEVNGPLAFVLMNLRTLEPRTSGADQQVVREAIDGAYRIEQIIRGLRVLFRTPGELVLEKVELVDLAVKTARIARARNLTAPITVESSGPVYVTGDQIGLGQILLNLMTNALDAVNEQGDPQVVVRVHHEDEAAVVDVSDNGSGIRNSLVPRVFDAFVTTKGKRGTGLGLGISRSFAEAHGGELTLHDTSSGGTRFRFAMMADSVMPSLRPSGPTYAGSPPLESHRKPKILVLDDEAALVRATRRWLANAAEVTGTTDPQEALRLTAEYDYAMVLCDLNMPKMSGLDFVRELRERDDEIAERVVIMTGQIEPDLEDVRVITKPVSPETMRELLNSIAAPEPSQPPTTATKIG